MRNKVLNQRLRDPELLLRIVRRWNFPGGPVVKNLPPHAGGTGSISGWESKIPRAFVAEKPRLKTNSIKT